MAGISTRPAFASASVAERPSAAQPHFQDYPS